MAEICVIYQSEDESIVERLVGLLRLRWDAWWAKEISHGDWEEAVRSEIGKASLVLPVLSKHTQGHRTSILRDEMSFAQSKGKPLLPFLIGPTHIPFGFGSLNHTEAHGWAGDEMAEGFIQLKTKVAATIGNGSSGHGGLPRLKELSIRGKILKLPAFVFSLSSHETQVWPSDGAELLNAFGPEAILISAYDSWKHYRNDREFKNKVKKIKASTSVLFLDSGNYESHRKNDQFSPKKNPTGWDKNLFREVASNISPDLAFTFDKVNPTGDINKIAKDTISAARSDRRQIPDMSIQLCPIVHLPKKNEGGLGECAAGILTAVADALDPLMIAIPERELGDGIIAKMQNVREIRASLNSLGKYYPLHLLGTGNPLSMVALAASGADSFDGLEWCRTVVDYENGFLFHFQHFECFSLSRINRIQDARARRLVENPDVPYTVRALAYNVDFFRDHAQTMQSLIHSGQTQTLLKMFPSIGRLIPKELSS